MIDLVIFDNDGTLVDSEPLGHSAMAEVLATLGVQVDPLELAAEFRGWELARELRTLARRHRCHLDDSHAADYRGRLAALMERELRAMPGAGAAVAAIAAMGLRQAVASGGPMQKIEQALRVTGLGPWFEHRVYSSYDVGSFKPEPGLFLHVAASMQCAPERCLVVEDSEVGIEAAQRAGMPAVLVGGADQATAVPCLASLRELPALVASRLAGAGQAATAPSRPPR